MISIKKYILACLMILVFIHAFSQEKNNNTPKEEGYEMKQYFFVMLTKGPSRSQDSATAAKIQKGHLDNINRLAAEGKIMVAGPFGDGGDWRGLFIFDAKSKEEVEGYLKTDPAIASGRLSYDIRPWWTAKNCVFK